MRTLRFDGRKELTGGATPGEVETRLLESAFSVESRGDVTVGMFFLRLREEGEVSLIQSLMLDSGRIRTVVFEKLGWESVLCYTAMCF